MLHNILGFGGRIGRLEYFLISIVFGLFMTLLVLALQLSLVPHGVALGSPGSTAFLLILLLIVLPIYLWFSFALQAKRFRDIGWDPLYVIPGWIFANMVNGALTLAFLTVHWIPWIGLLFNLFMSCALLFWPSAPTGTGDWGGGTHAMGSPEPQPYRPREPSPAPRPAAATWSPAPAQTPSGFGRRGL